MTTGAFFFFAYMVSLIFIALCAGIPDLIDAYKDWRQRRG